MNEIPTVLEVSDMAAKNLFRNLALNRGLDPDNLWVGGYVAYEWVHNRHIFQTYTSTLRECISLSLAVTLVQAQLCWHS